MKKTLILALAATSLTLGGTALAQDNQRGADVTRADAEARAATMFARMDVNSDGVLNPADREARARARFAEQDANGDGMLSFEEMQAAREEHRANRAERRANRGAERSGGEAMAERGERRQRGERMGGRGGRGGERGGERGMMRSADSNGDGAISQAEFTTAALARFDRADADGNGTLTAEERRAQRGERRGGNRGNRG